MGISNWRPADYALAYDAVSRLAGAVSEEEAVTLIFGLFRMICDPEVQIYCGVRKDTCQIISEPQSFEGDAKAKQQLLMFKGEYAWTPSGKGFILRIQRHDQMLGVLEIDGVHLPERREEYLNLALGIKDVLGLAISNARLFKELEDRVEERTAEAFAARSQIQLLLDSTAEGIFGLDLEGNCIFVNKAAAEMVDFTPEELIGKNVHYLVHSPPGSSANILFEDCPVYKVLHGGKGARVYDAVFWTKGLCPFPVEFVINQIVREGNVVGAVFAFTDITQRKKAEEELRRKEHDIRMAYADVFSAVTGGRLLFMTEGEVDKSLGEPLTEEGEITDYKQLSAIREEYRRILPEHFPEVDQTDGMLVAISEALTNAVKHAGKGQYRLFKNGTMLQVWVHDYGPGIDFKTLPKATLLAGFSTKASLGMGFNIMLEICDRLLLATEAGSTTVVLEFRGPTGGEEETDILDTFATWE